MNVNLTPTVKPNWWNFRVVLLSRTVRRETLNSGPRNLASKSY